jgi:hypothetical protein
LAGRRSNPLRLLRSFQSLAMTEKILNLES